MTYLRFTSLVLIFSAFFCNRIRAQFSIAEQPMFQLTSSASDFDGSLQSIPGVHTYWVWTNGIITNQLLRVTNWTALVSPIDNAFKKVGPSANDDPRSATNGVFFDNWTDGSWLTSSIVTFPSNQNYTIGMIQKQNRPSGTPSITLLWFKSGSPDSGIYSRTSDTNLVIDIRSWGGAANVFSAGYIGTNRSDFVIVCSNSAIAGVEGGIYAYIDGVLRTNKQSLIWSNMASKWARIGGNSDIGGAAYDGSIYDIVFYTNVMTPQNISNFHYYNTNVYGPTGSGT